MTISPKAPARLQFVGIIFMSIGLGVLLMTALDKWFRGDSMVWWLVLVALFAFVISVNSVTVMKRLG